MSVINLNCDMGESYGRYRLGNDEELVALVPTINVACGFHAGDPHVMRRTVACAIDRGVEIGAHVGLPDLLGFGRRRLVIEPPQLADYVTYQLGALEAFVHAAGGALTHVKPHGMLYTMCQEEKAYATALLDAVAEHHRGLAVIAGGEHAAASGRMLGLAVTTESYIDLDYGPGGLPVIEPFKRSWDPSEVAHRALSVVTTGTAAALDGRTLSVPRVSLCIHGDAGNAVAVAQKVRSVLAREGIDVVGLRAAMTDRS
jgi:5-oxoprolinase (ATP-hydrolysing) subunit A